MEHFDFNRYVWRADSDVSGRHIREAGGAEAIEDLWKVTKHGEQNLFIGIYASLSVPVASDVLLAHVKSAWRALRWEVPTIAASTSHIWHQDGRPPTAFIVYDEAKSNEDVEKWISETVESFPTYGIENKTLDDLRYDIGQEPIPVNDFDRQTFLYLVPYSTTKFGLLLRTAHTTFDGVGVKVLMTKILGHLASYIVDAGSEHLTMEWGTGKEAGWLNPIQSEILREDEPEVKDDEGRVISEARTAVRRDGPEYWETLGDVMTGLVTGIPRAHPFKSFIQPPFDPKTSMPKTRRLGHKFTVEESIRIQAAGSIGNNGLTEKLTVNHLVHGALTLLPLFDNPPAPNTDAVVLYFGLVDGRSYLRKEYREPQAFPGYCLGMSSLHIRASLFHQFSKDDKRGLVLEYAKETKREYVRQAAYPCLIAVTTQQGDLMMNAPPSPPWAGPAYAADGKGAFYLHPKYVAGNEGKTIIEVDDFILGLNKCDPGPFFRCTEWKGQIILSVDFNELAVSEEVVKGWMALWVELLLAVTV